MQIADGGPATRMSMDVLAELCVDGVAHAAVIHRLSKYGAFLRCDHEQLPRANVELAIEIEGEPRIVTAVTIVYRVDTAEAAKLGTVAGVGVRFVDPFSRAAEQFATVVEQVLACGNLVAAKPTRRMRATGVPEPQPDRPGFSGTLAGLGVPNLLSLLETTRKTGRLVLVSDQVTATLDFSDGQIVGVQSNLSNHSPHKVLMIVTGWSEGTFELASIAPPPRPADDPLRMSVTRLLLAHALLLDKVAAARQGADHQPDDVSSLSVHR